MIFAVFDCNVLMSGLGWRSEPYHCLVQIARRRSRPFVTEFLVEEYCRVARRLEAEGHFKCSIWPGLDWVLSVARRVDPAPLGKQRSGDPKDDPYLACALAAQAEYIVSRDPHLLDLEKPFGIEIVTPRAFLNRVAAGR